MGSKYFKAIDVIQTITVLIKGFKPAALDHTSLNNPDIILLMQYEFSFIGSYIWSNVIKFEHVNI